MRFLWKTCPFRLIFLAFYNYIPNIAAVQSRHRWLGKMAGIYNMGLLCYANSVYQCLSNSQENHLLLEQHFNMHTIPGKLHIYLVKTTQCMTYCGHSKYVNLKPSKIYRRIKISIFKLFLLSIPLKFHVHSLLL